MPHATSRLQPSSWPPQVMAIKTKTLAAINVAEFQKVPQNVKGGQDQVDGRGRAGLLAHDYLRFPDLSFIGL